MAKIRILCFLSLDGCLLDRRSLSVLCDPADKYGIGKIRKEATRYLEEPVSFVSLSQWKQEADGLALVESCPEALSLIGSLLRFDMADELVVYLYPAVQGGLRVFEEKPSPSFWRLTGSKSFRNGICRLSYSYVGCWRPAAL